MAVPVGAPSVRRIRLWPLAVALVVALVIALGAVAVLVLEPARPAHGLRHGTLGTRAARAAPDVKGTRPIAQPVNAYTDDLPLTPSWPSYRNDPASGAPAARCPSRDRPVRR